MVNYVSMACSPNLYGISIEMLLQAVPGDPDPVPVRVGWHPPFGQ